MLLAAGAGNRLEPLTDGQPKCLLPVYNQPLIHYQLKVLENAGFSGRASHRLSDRKWLEIDRFQRPSSSPRILTHTESMRLSKRATKAGCTLICSSLRTGSVRPMPSAPSDHASRYSLNHTSLSHRHTTSCSHAHSTPCLPALPKGDFVVVSGDVVTDIPLVHVLNVHRANDAVLTVLLTEKKKKQPTGTSAQAPTSDDPSSDQ